MKQIKDKVKCERAIEKLELEKEFDTQNLEFQIYQYEKGNCCVNHAIQMTGCRLL